MKTEIWNTVAIVLGVLGLAVLGPWLWGQVRTLPASPALAARANQRVVTLDVAGMTCGGCAARVRGELAETAGVSAVDVRHANGRAYVVCRRDLADTTLVAAVSRAGPGFRAFVATP